MSTPTVAPAAGTRFTIASRAQRRFSANQTVTNTTATSLAPISLPATGWLRKVSILFTQTATFASGGAVVAGDGPWNLVQSISLSDGVGQPIIQPISGYNLYLVNKYMGSDLYEGSASNKLTGPEFAFASSATTATATFRLDLDLEMDARTGYGCISNQDSNCALQLRIDIAASSAAFTGTTLSVPSMNVRVVSHYWAPVLPSTGGVPNKVQPPGFGDFLETRYENQTATAQAENTSQVFNRGGVIQGLVCVSRAAGARVAFTAASNVGLLFDNNAVYEGVTLESHNDHVRRQYGYFGDDLTTSYAPPTAGVEVGLDAGVLVFPFHKDQKGRDGWLSTRPGTTLQVKHTPGASATQFEIVTRLAQIRDVDAFYEA